MSAAAAESPPRRLWLTAGLPGVLIALGAFGAFGACARASDTAAGYLVYVSNERSGDVTVIDGGALTVLATLPVGKRPRGIHASSDGRSVYVALSGSPIAGPGSDRDIGAEDRSADGIGVLDVARDTVTHRIAAGTDPEEFALSRDGRQLYVANEESRSATVVDVASGTIVREIPVGEEPEGVETAPDGRSFYVTCEGTGEVFAIETRSFSVVGHFTVPVRPRSVAFLPGAPRAIVPSEMFAQLNVVDTARRRVTRVVPLPEGSRPMRVKLSPDGGRLYVSNGRAGTISVLDARSYALLANVAVGPRPWGLGISPDGRYLFVANGPSNDVSVVDLASNREIRRIPAGSGPWGIAIATRKPSTVHR